MSEKNTYLHVTCPDCGSPEVSYSADKEMLLCNHCGFAQELVKDNDRVVERSLDAGLQLEGIPKGLELEVKEFHCDNCGSSRMVDPDEVRVQCPFCGSENVNEAAHLTQIIEPSGVLPFTFPRKKAETAFLEWIGEGFFRPSKLSEMASLENLHGVYLPFWTFDAFTRSSWHAMAGYHYMETESFMDEDNNTQTEQVRKTRWQPASGYFEHFFDDVLILASNGIKQREVDDVSPFDIENLVNYDSQYLLGWECEVYQKEIEVSMKEAERKMDAYIRAQCRDNIPGDIHRDLEVSTEKNRHTFKHILLPVWTAGYTYRGKAYHFLINGRTGKISGKKPYSYFKIVGAILAAAVLVVFMVFLFEQWNK